MLLDRRANAEEAEKRAKALEQRMGGGRTNKKNNYNAKKQLLEEEERLRKEAEDRK